MFKYSALYFKIVQHVDTVSQVRARANLEQFFWPGIVCYWIIVLRICIESFFMHMGSPKRDYFIEIICHNSQEKSVSKKDNEVI